MNDMIVWHCFHCRGEQEGTPESWNIFKNLPDYKGRSSTLYVCDSCMEEGAQ